MKAVKIIGVLFLLFTAYTIVGMVLSDQRFWAVYNYITLALSISSAIVLLKQK